MKTLVPIVTITAALSLIGALASHGQQPPEPPPPPAVQETEGLAREGADLARAEVRHQLKDVQQQQNAQLDQMRRTQVAQAATAGGGGFSPGAPGNRFTDRLQTIVRRTSGGAGKTLVIRSSESSPKEQANLEEDLAVMSRIFDNALAQKMDEDHPRRAMGINVFFTPDSNPIRSLYLDGYGALFLLNVSFPLLPPPPKPDAQKEKPPVDSTWAEARRELYDRHDDSGNPMALRYGMAGPVEEYSEEKVNKLKDALLEALKSATNIRNLKSDDSITACVFGGASAGPGRSRTVAKRTPGEPAEVADALMLLDRGSSAPMRGTILTIRVKKSDADAFAKGKLSLDEFRKKAGIAIYAGDVGGGSGNFPFGAGGGSSGGGGSGYGETR